MPGQALGLSTHTGEQPSRLGMLVSRWEEKERSKNAQTQHLGADATGDRFPLDLSFLLSSVCGPKIFATCGQPCLYTHYAYKLTEDLSRQANTLQRIALLPRLEAQHKSELLGFL